MAKLDKRPPGLRHYHVDDLSVTADTVDPQFTHVPVGIGLDLSHGKLLAQTRATRLRTEGQPVQPNPGILDWSGGTMYSYAAGLRVIQLTPCTDDDHIRHLGVL